MARFRARVDENQSEIVKALRAVGASVESLASLGGGCVDLLVGFRGVNYLMEVKDGNKSPSRRKLRQDQVAWHGAWRGKTDVVESSEHALKVIGL